MKHHTTLVLGASAVALLAFLPACGGSETPSSQPGTTGAPEADATGGDKAAGTGAEEKDEHDEPEVRLGTLTIAGLELECFQGHGEVAPGKEMHLVAFPKSGDNGASTVRAWIGTENRLESRVVRADFHTDHGDYDAHVEAPEPLPADARWWIEVERPDGTKAVASIEYH